MEFTSSNLSLEQEKFLQNLLRFVREKNFFESKDRLLLATSGGLDSTVLAHAMARVAKILDVEVCMVHVDHGTRGPSSAQEARWVGVLAQRLNLACYSLSIPPEEKSSQAQLRDRRRELLSTLADELGCRRILTAHHGDDNVETFVMRAMAGTGLKGLASISPVEGRWVRPLLWASRAEIVDYARKHQLAWVEDPSNQRGIYLRNRLRLELLPLMEEIRPGALRNINRLAERIESEEREWEVWLSTQLDDNRESLALGWLEKWPEVLQRRALRVWLARLSVSPDPLLIEALLRGEDIVHSRGSFFRGSDQLIFRPGEDFAEIWEKPLALKMGQRLKLGPSLAWSFLAAAPAKTQSLSLSLNWVFREPREKALHRQQFAWARVPTEVEVRARSKEDPREFDSFLAKANIPKPYWKAWPVLSARENPRQVLALVGIHVIPEYAHKELERCVCLEAFFEDNLSLMS